MDLAKHSGFMNWGYKSNWITTYQIKINVGFPWEGNTQVPGEKHIRAE